MSKLADFAIITILLGAALCLIIPSLLRLQHLSRSRKRSTRNDAPYSAKPMPVRAKAVAPIAKVTAFRWQSLINLKVPSADVALRNPEIVAPFRGERALFEAIRRATWW